MQTIYLKLTGNTPSKKNSKIMVCRGGRPILLPSKAHKAWHEEKMWELKAELKKISSKLPIKTTKMVSLSFTAATKHKWDLSNKAESIMDILVDVGILEDDNYTVVPHLELHFEGVDKVGGAGCEVVINY